ncbi:MAG: redoxin family protein [Candidatus Hydrogenedentes bacterium]|nr:redoxin family protein [Candidatus Hydrogenedentota bacterium]
MYRQPIVLLVLAILCLAPLSAWAEDRPMPAPISKMPNFRLLDQHGVSHELYRYRDSRAIVLYVQGNGCPIVRLSFPILKRMQEQYESQGVKFLMINANFQDDRGGIAAELKEFAVAIPVLHDSAQIVTKTLGCERTADTFLINPADWSIAYRGAVDDRYDYGAQKPDADHHWLRDAIDALLAGKPAPVSYTAAKGCLINYMTEDREYTYVQDAAPIFARHCISCHSKGDVAPFALDSYKRAQGWASMIKEVILTDRMPPWDADPAYGHFKNVRSLSEEEQAILVSWVDQGSPRGEGDDSLEILAATQFRGKYRLGEPDRIVKMSEPFEVPAEGVLEYQLIEVPSGLTEDTWVRGMEVVPGNKEVLHHALVFIKYPDSLKDLEPDVLAGAQGYFAGFVPGEKVLPFPEGTGKFIPADSSFIFQMHYVTTGKPQVDQTELALYLCKEPPPEELVTQAAFNGSFEVPPGARDHAVSGDMKFWLDAKVWGLAPHMHYRGSRFKYTAQLPDGTSQVLLSVPHYRFDWQTMYWFEDPVQLPKGSVMLCEGAFDNSTTNPANPDPTDTVIFGDQTFQEMFIGYINYSVPRGAIQEARANFRNGRSAEREAEAARIRAENKDPNLTAETIIGTTWTGGEFKMNYQKDGVVMVNGVIKGAYRIENDKVVMDIVGQHHELDIIGQKLYFNGVHELTRLE